MHLTPPYLKLCNVVLFSALFHFTSPQVFASAEPALSKPLAPTTVIEADLSAQTTQASTSKLELQKVLAQFSFLNADFVQEIVDVNGQKIGTGTGKFSVLKPNYLYWLTQTPDQSLIVADGEAVWLFDPFIEQASVYNLSASIANTPILLLTTNDKSLWNKFTVTKTSDVTYNIVANDTNSQIKTLNLEFIKNANINAQKQLASFSMEDATGQVSTITLSNVDHTHKPSEDLFHFTLPEGAYLDDQR